MSFTRCSVVVQRAKGKIWRICPAAIFPASLRETSTPSNPVHGFCTLLWGCRNREQDPTGYPTLPCPTLPARPALPCPRPPRPRHCHWLQRPVARNLRARCDVLEAQGPPQPPPPTSPFDTLIRLTGPPLPFTCPSLLLCSTSPGHRSSPRLVWVPTGLGPSQPPLPPTPSQQTLVRPPWFVHPPASQRSFGDLPLFSAAAVGVSRRGAAALLLSVQAAPSAQT